MRSRIILIVCIGYIALIALLITSCKKQSITEQVHADTTITGNTPPNYTGVPTITINQYVNKLYVDVLGRQPTTTESSTNVNYLITNNLSDSARGYVINQLFIDTNFYTRTFSITSSQFINGTGYTDIISELQQFYYIRQLDSSNGRTLYVANDNYEIGRLNKLDSASLLFRLGKITMNEYYRRFLDNYFFDQVNMGTANFCKASFEDLFSRDPTASELTSSETMVNGSPSNVFLKDGSNKSDFENIVTGCDEFYEGYVIQIYLQYLLRKPNSQESADGTTALKTTGDYKKLQLQLLKSKEYAGF